MSGLPTLCMVTPDLLGSTGGIARIARATALALYGVSVEQGWQLAVLALNDQGSARDERYLPNAVTYRGFGGSRVALGRSVVGLGRGKRHVGTVFCHVNLATLGLLYPFWNSSSPRRYAVVAHGVDVWSRLRFNRRLSLQLAAEVWPVSDYTARAVTEKQGVPESRVRRIYNCLDPHWPEETAPASRQDRPYVLAVSRLSRRELEKGVDTLIRAFGCAARSVLDLSLVIAGNGEDRVRLRALADAQELGDRVVFAGSVSDEQLSELYRSCSFFALPSAKEGFGLVFLEAMAAGKAVLAAASGAAPEVVAHGETGLLVPYGDVKQLAGAIVELASDANRSKRLGEAGRERANRLFSFDAYRENVHKAVLRLWADGVRRPDP